MLNKWTKKEDDFLIKNHQNMSYREIARSLNNGRNARGISKRAIKLNLRKMTFISTKIEIDQKFGKLTAKREGKTVKSQKEVRRYWFFLCDCGNIKEINIRSVIINLVKSCGCLAHPPDRSLSLKTPGYASWNHIFNTCRGSAKARKLSFCLTREQFKNISAMNCHYCGSDPLKWNVYVKKDGTTRNKQYYSIKKDTIERAWIFANGIDRENNNLGYVIENCVPCCRHCNEMKMDRDTINFLEHVKKINNFQANKK